jgi:hypothetical protein
MDEPRYQAVSEVRRDGIALGLVAAMLVAGAIALPHLPARVAIHWNVAGQVNGWAAPTTAAFLSPTMALGIWALLLLAPTIDPRRSACTMNWWFPLTAACRYSMVSDSRPEMATTWMPAGT